MMKKLLMVQLKDAVRTAEKTETILHAKDYELTLRDGIVIDIKSLKKGVTTQTSLFNVSGWQEAPVAETQAAPKAAKVKA